jgi:hypothetical protein
MLYNKYSSNTIENNAGFKEEYWDLIEIMKVYFV